MKKLLLTLLITIFFSVSYAYAGCSNGKCLIQLHDIYEVEKFINEHPYQISGISIRPGSPYSKYIFYIWYTQK